MLNSKNKSFEPLNTLQRAERRLSDTLNYIDKDVDQKKDMAKAREDEKKEENSQFAQSENPLELVEKLSSNRQKNVEDKILALHYKKKMETRANSTIQHNNFEDTNLSFKEGIEALTWKKEDRPQYVNKVNQQKIDFKKLNTYHYNDFEDIQEIQGLETQSKGKLLKKLMGEEMTSEEFSEDIVNVVKTNEIETKKNEIIDLARQEADRMIKEAYEQIETMKLDIRSELEKQFEIEKREQLEKNREEGFQQGYQDGLEKGITQGVMDGIQQANEQKKQEAEIFAEKIQKSLEDFQIQKEKLLKKNLPQLTELSLAVAEKIVRISLKSSSDVILKMIEVAAENVKKARWAKVYISERDREIVTNAEEELLEALSGISEDIKVVIMEEEPEGTCIIETEDKIIDAGAFQQLSNIENIVKEHGEELELEE